MNTNEFKIWIQGFCEAIGEKSLPTKEQWGKIIGEVRNLDGPTAPFVPTIVNNQPPINAPNEQLVPRDLDAQTTADLEEHDGVTS